MVNQKLMTKRQALTCIRCRVEHYLVKSIEKRDSYEEGTSFHEYYSGRVDSYDHILGFLSDYDDFM